MNMNGAQPLNVIEELNRKVARRRRIIRWSAIPIAVLGAAGAHFGATGASEAGPLPTSGPTFAMTSHNPDWSNVPDPTRRDRPTPYDRT